jgi:hypothetical protein
MHEKKRVGKWEINKNARPSSVHAFIRQGVHKLSIQVLDAVDDLHIYLLPGSLLRFYLFKHKFYTRVYSVHAFTSTC